MARKRVYSADDLERMAEAVWERAQDFAEYADPRDYDSPKEYKEAIKSLDRAAKVLSILAEMARSRGGVIELG